MKTALFFILNGVGGAERISTAIARMLLEDNWNVLFAKINNPLQFETSQVEDIIPEKTPIATVPFTGQCSFFRNMYRIISQVKPDIVFCSIFAINLRLLMLRPLFKRTKFIVRNDNYIDTLNPIKTQILKRTYNYADAIIAQTDEMQTEMIKLGINRSLIHVLQNPVNSELILNKAKAPSPFPDDNRKRFIAIGRFSADKGFDILIKAFSFCIKQIPTSELYIIGDYTANGGRIHSQLKALAESLGVSSQVTFVGYTDNPYKYLKNSSAFVLSSRNEGLPNVLVEAQCLGIPSAATKCRPIVERIITEGQNGYLAEVGDAASLAQAMLNAVSLSRCVSTYSPATKHDFVQLFNDCVSPD